MRFADPVFGDVQKALGDRRGASYKILRSEDLSTGKGWM